MAKVLIYGAGAIGSLVGYILSEAEGDRMVENVALLGRRSHIEKVKSDGLKVNLPDGTRQLRFRYCFSSLDDLGGSGFYPDVVVICVKTHALKGVRDELISSGVLREELKGAKIMLLMNGMGNREVLTPIIPDVLEGITSMGVKFSEGGSIDLKGMGLTTFEMGVPMELKSFLKDKFKEKGFEINFARDFKRQQWMKLIVNSAINPITAITGGKNEIVLSRHLQGTVERAVRECVRIASLEGHEIDEPNALDLVRSIASRTAMNTSSMLQDVLKGKRTEIDSINGYVVALGEKHSLDVPVNETLYSLVKVMEQKIEG